MQRVTGFFDLCVNEAAIVGNFEETIKSLYSHGYRTIAINYTLKEEELKENKGQGQGKKKRKGDNQPKENEKSIIPQARKHIQVKGCESMTILNRLTVHLATKDFYAKITKMVDYKKFDIIAIRPMNATIFGVTCNELDADILSISTQQKSEFKILRKNYNQLLANGYHFEIPYTGAIIESTRRLVISYAHSLHVVGKSRNVIISSGIKSASQIRSPYDIINMALILGLNKAQSKMALMQNCRNTYSHAVSRRYGKVAMLGINVELQVAPPTQTTTDKASTEVDVIELDDDDVEDVGHQLKKIKT